MHPLGVIEVQRCTF